MCAFHFSKHFQQKINFMKKEKVIDQFLLEVEELDQRIAPGLTDLGGLTGTLPVLCPPPSDCPPPPSDCPPSDGTETDGGNNGYGNGGYDGVPGSSADNDSPNADEKEADQVR
jgi:hypothetical protein